MPNLRILVLTITMISIMGCSSGFRIPYVKDLKQSQIKIHLVTTVPQKEISARISASNTSTAIGLQMGFIGAAIGSALDASINNNRFIQKEKQISPLRQALANFDLDNLHYEKIFLVIDNFKTLKLISSKKEKQAKSTNLVIGDTYLKIASSYELTENFNSLEFTTDVTLYKAHKHRKAKVRNSSIQGGNILYRNRYKYISPILALAKKSREEKAIEEKEIELWFFEKTEKLKSLPKREFKVKTRLLNKQKRKKVKTNRRGYTRSERNFKMAEKWSIDGAEIIKTYFNEALNETIKMIKIDFLSTESNEELKNNESLPLSYYGLQIVSKQNNRIILRDISSEMSGQLCSVTKNTNTYHCLPRTLNSNPFFY